MPTVNELHNQSMDLAEEAFRLRRRGQHVEAEVIFERALALESEAASQLPEQIDSEPTRSILFHSAAQLAIHMGDFEAAQRLAAKGLAGHPPPHVKHDLTKLLQEVAFRGNLAARGLELGDDEWEFAIGGQAIGHGQAEAELIIERVEKLSTLFYRTVERKLGLAYRKAGSTLESIRLRQHYGLYLNGFAPGSVALSFKVGSPIRQLQLYEGTEYAMLDPTEIVTELLSCFELLEEDQLDGLRTRIPNEDYFVNFVGLARDILPDGEQVEYVRFRATSSGQERLVGLTKTKQEVPSAPALIASLENDNQQGPGERVVLRGLLKKADSLAVQNEGRVTLVAHESGKKHTINVPIGLMKDTVQRLYEEAVIITAVRTGQKLYLQDIDRDEPPQSSVNPSLFD